MSFCFVRCVFGALWNNRGSTRRGTIVVLVAVLLIPMLGIVAFTVDYGYLLLMRTDLQRAADSAALAAVQDLVPASDGTQNLATVRNTVRQYATSNIGGSYQVLDSDIQIGRYDPATVYTSVTLLNTGVYDTVRVTLRRDTQANSPVSLFMARVLGRNDANVTATATAILQKPSILKPGDDVLPFAVPIDVWDDRIPGEPWSIYGDGKLADKSGNTIPGNWGTADIGSTINSTSDKSDAILIGLRQQDIDALYADARISTNTHIDSTQPMWINGNTGLSSGLKSAVQAIHGMSRIVPLYDTLTGGGENLEFHIVGWGVVTVVDSNWQGSTNTWVKVQKAYTYYGELGAQGSLSNTVGVIDGAFTSPALVE